jgi:uncharacterized SAM-binding protein YcdF (DUF218 family)
MFFLLSKLLNWFVYPLSLLFVGLLAILVFYRRRYTRWGLAFVLLLFYSLSAPITVLPLVRWLEGPRPGPEALRQHYDVAIVLTGMVSLGRSRPGHLEFNEHVDRILEGISLVKRGVADKLFIVGGSGDLFNRGASEARQLRIFALEFGLLDEQVLVEEMSRNTYENAVKATEIMRAGQYRELVLITSALHMHRAAAAFHKQGLFPDLYPVDFQSNNRGGINVFSLLPSTRALDVMTSVIHELIGVVTYRLQGYI